MGVVVSGAWETTAADADAGDKLGVPANQLPIAADATPAADDTAAALMADEAAADATAPCAPAEKVNLTPADVDPGAISTVAVAPGKRASIAACTAAESAALSGLANVICVVTALGVAAAEASDTTAVEVEASERLVPANHPTIDCHRGATGDEAPFAALMAAEAAIAAASPIVPGGKDSRTLAVENPGVTLTVTAVTVGYCARITD